MAVMEVLGEFKWTKNKNEELCSPLKGRNSPREVQHRCSNKCERHRETETIWDGDDATSWHHVLSSVDWHTVRQGMAVPWLENPLQKEKPGSQVSTQLTAYTAMDIFPLLLLKRCAVWYSDFYFYYVSLLITWWHDPSKVGTLKGFCVSFECWFLQSAVNKGEAHGRNWREDREAINDATIL